MLSRRSASADGSRNPAYPTSPPAAPQGVELKVAAATKGHISVGFPPFVWPERKYQRAVATLEAERDHQYGPARGGYRLALRFFDELHPPPLEPPKTIGEAGRAKEDALGAAARLLEYLEADLVTVLPHEAHWLGGKGLLQPLDRFIGGEDAMLNREFYPSVVSAFRSGDALFGLPIAARPLMLHYDEHYFDELGMPPVDAGWDWEDLVEAAAKLTTYRKDGSVARWGLVAHLEDILWALWQNRTTVVDPDNMQCRLPEPAAIEALQFVHDLMHKHGVSPPVSGIDLWEMLFSRRWLPAMLFDYSPSYFNDGAFRMAPLPRGKVHAVPMKADLGLAITARTKHTAAAYRALVGLTQAMQEQVMIPAGRAAAARLRNSRPDLGAAEVAAIQHSLEFGRPWPEPGPQFAVMHEAIERLARGEDVAKIANEACAHVDEFQQT